MKINTESGAGVLSYQNSSPHKVCPQIRSDKPGKAGHRGGHQTIVQRILRDSGLKFVHGGQKWHIPESRCRISSCPRHLNSTWGAQPAAHRYSRPMGKRRPPRCLDCACFPSILAYSLTQSKELAQSSDSSGRANQTNGSHY